MSNTKVKTSSETTKIPNAVEMAHELIKDNPGLFQDNPDTVYALANSMVTFYRKCDDYLAAPVSLFERLGNIAKTHAKIYHDIDLEEDQYINGPEEAIMNRGCHGQF